MTTTKTTTTTTRRIEVVFFSCNNNNNNNKKSKSQQQKNHNDGRQQQQQQQQQQSSSCFFFFLRSSSSSKSFGCRLFLVLFLMTIQFFQLRQATFNTTTTTDYYYYYYDNNNNNKDATMSTKTTSSSSSSSLSENNGNSHNTNKKVTIAYAISYIQCSSSNDDANNNNNNVHDEDDTTTSSIGVVYRDAALVLRHSIHKIHLQSKYYDYKMYAFIHRQAQNCSKQFFNDIGFHTILVDPLVQKSEIQDEYLRNHISNEKCCGEAEFIKLYAYSILPEEEHPITVHVDMDFIFLKPIDHLFDAILYDKHHPRGIAARNQIELETPTDGFPNKIGAFWTRDWPQVIPFGDLLPGYQAGFLVARHDPTVVDELKNIIQTVPYKPGKGRGSGWGGSGHSQYIGAMAVQGLLAYYYDYHHKSTVDDDVPAAVVELNQCRYNHMGMDVRYRTQPHFIADSPHVGQCRNAMKYNDCEDCRVTNITQIYNVHYTTCSKPWTCIGTGGPNVVGPHANPKYEKPAINTISNDFDHCMELLHYWHEMRTDLEDQLLLLLYPFLTTTNDSSILLNNNNKKGRDGSYKPEIFHGHCAGDGSKYYLPILGGGGGVESSKMLERLKELYS